MTGILTADLSTELGVIEATIAEAGNLTAAIDLKAGRAHRINLPAAFDNADITFQVSDDGADWFDLFNSAGEYKIAAAAVGASRSLLLDFQTFYGVRHLKIRSGTASAAVAQAAERAITISTVPRG